MVSCSNSLKKWRYFVKVFRLVFFTFSAGILAIGLSSPLSAATVTNTIDATHPGSGTNLWTPSLGLEKTDPYYRGNGEDWGWQHDAIAGTISKATLNVSAFDVDADALVDPEVDRIEAFNTNTSSWDFLGNLIGGNDTFKFTPFVLSGSWFDEIALGLQVRIIIDSTTKGWFVSLGKSSLSIDGSFEGNPNPGQVPVPAAIWLFGSGLVGLFGLRKKSGLAA
jgi:hypothetical protein